MKNNTACECAGPGWCDRHRIYKGDYLVETCRRCPDYFDLWELGIGPFQSSPARPPRDPCCHRNSSPHREVLCELCGERQLQVPVFRCAVYGECTERRYGIRSVAARTTQACLSCPEYQSVNDVKGTASTP